ncbi:MAG: thymidine kinase [Bacilli bacterium]|nr:thymidine kinase [Bacilli bacterium]
MAKLYFRYGAMNCGKTTLLLQTYHNYEENGLKAVIAKPSIDTKGNTKIVSRIGLEREVDLLLKADDNIFDIVKKKYKKVDCVLVDEAQFLKKEQVNQCMEIVVKLNIPVMCFGLRTDFLTNGFEGATRLLEIADSIDEMRTICRCGKKASFNARFVNDKFTLSGEQVAIDGKDNVTYKPMCAKCYAEEKNKIDKK